MMGESTLKSDSVGYKLEKDSGPAVEEYGLLVEQLEVAADRMRAKTDICLFGGFLYNSQDVIMTGDSYSNYTFMSDKPHELPFPDTVYHVSGLSVLDTLGKGDILTSKDDHFRRDTLTDKGLMLWIVPEFMKSLGIKLGLLNQFLFSGPLIDAEQIIHFNRSAFTDIDEKIAEIFLNHSGKKTRPSDLNPVLKKVLCAIDKGIKPFEHPELKKMVDQVITLIYEIPNIREGWLDQIRETLYGNRKVELAEKSLYESVKHKLLSQECMYRILKDGRSNVKSKPAVVLEIDTHKLIDDTSYDGLFPVLVGNRPIESIFSSITIVPSAIRAAYIDPNMLTAGRDIKFTKVLSLDDLPIDKMLGGIGWRDVIPNMNSPLCAIRYSGTQTRWVDLAREGLIAPAKTIYQKSYFDDDPLLIRIFGEQTFDFTNDPNYQKYPKAFGHQICKKYPQIKGVFN